MKTLLLSAAIALLPLGTAATAATITFSQFASSTFDNATAGLNKVSSETFEGLGATLGEGEIAPGTSLEDTAVGAFSTLGGVGSGGTVRNLPGNTGQNIALRDGNVFGRKNTTAGGSYFLDSNDTWGIGWDATNGGRMFDTLVFTLRDASEFSFLRVIVDGISAEQRVGGALGNGNTSIVQISLSDAVQSLRVELGNFTSSGGSNASNDGFSIDDVTLGLTAVPVPATLPLLMAGAGAFGFIRRKQRKAA